MTEKDIADIWDAIRSIRLDIDKLRKANETVNADFLARSYTSIVEKLEVVQKDIDTLKR